MPYLGNGLSKFTTADDLTVNGDAEVTGTVNPSGDTASGDAAAVGFTSAEGLILTGQGSTSDITVKNDADATVFTVPTGTDDILFPDSAKILMGNSSDLEIFHESGNSFIKDNGTGDLVFRTNGDNILLQNSNNQNMIRADSANGEVKLFHGTSSGVEKLATTSTGINIQGSAGATLKLTSTDTTGADTELLGQIDFVSSDSSTGSAGTQARIKGVYEDNGDSSGIAFLAGASTGSGTPTISEVMRIRHEGRVGIKTTAPDAALHVLDTSLPQTKIAYDSNRYMNIEHATIYNVSGASQSNSLKIASRGYSGGNDIIFATGGTDAAGSSEAERMKILAGGNIDISAGHILLDNGYGINFAATSDAGGMTSEILDDYEEGTWTASVVGSGGGTAQTMSGYYTKVGNIVYVHASARSGLNLSSSSGVLVINGLPFTGKSGADQLFQLIHNNAGTYPSGRTQLDAYVYGNTQIVAITSGSGVGWNDFNIGSNTSAGLIVSGTYEVA